MRVLAALLFLFSLSTSVVAATNQSKGSGQIVDANQISQSDVRILQLIHVSNRTQILAAAFAMTKSESRETQQFTSDILQDFSRREMELLHLTAELGIDLENVPEDMAYFRAVSNDLLRVLTESSPKTVDADYMKVWQESQQDFLRRLDESILVGVQNQKIKEFAQKISISIQDRFGRD